MNLYCSGILQKGLKELYYIDTGRIPQVSKGHIDLLTPFSKIELLEVGEQAARAGVQAQAA
jgi:hypothetical protein